jgi:hypothetical protein
MEGDIKEVIGTLMRVIDGGEVSRAEVEDLSFATALDDLQVGAERRLSQAHGICLRPRGQTG